MKRDPIPEPVRRSVLVEAGHRCAIPTCRATPVDIAHIVPWSKTKDHSEGNLIALCPTCHRRYDRGEIDRQSMKAYKTNLGVIHGRYGELERRIFEAVARSGERLVIVGAGGDLLCAHAVRDGLLEHVPGIKGVDMVVEHEGQPYGTFPTTFGYWVTEEGMRFVQRYQDGREI